MTSVVSDLCTKMTSFKATKGRKISRSEVGHGREIEREGPPLLNRGDCRWGTVAEILIVDCSGLGAKGL